MSFSQIIMMHIIQAATQLQSLKSRNGFEWDFEISRVLGFRSFALFKVRWKAGTIFFKAGGKVPEICFKAWFGITFEEKKAIF